MVSTMPAEQRFDRLVALLPSLEAGTCAQDVLEKVVYEDRIMPQSFDWPAWKDEGHRYLEPGGVETADLEICRRLLTVLVRQERFVEGSLDAALKDGLVGRVVRRVAEVVANAGH